MAARGQKPITVYSIAALVVLLIGGGGTLTYANLRLDAWMRSGTKFAIGAATSVDLSPGDHVVFFESPDVLPGDPYAIHFFISDPTQPGVRIPASAYGVDEAEDYAPRFLLPTTSVYGRPMWRVQIPAAGTYSFRVENDHEEQNVQLDRVVFHKDQPQSFKAFQQANQRMMFVMFMIIGAIVIGLYVMHAVTLSRRASASIPSPTLVPMEEDR